MEQKNEMVVKPKLSSEELRIINEAVIIRAWMKDNKILPNANLKDDLCLDSLEFVEMIMDLEREFHIHIQDEEMKQIKTVGDIYEVVSHKLAEK